MKRRSAGFILGVITLGLAPVCSAYDWQLRAGVIAQNFKHGEFTSKGNVKEDGELFGVSLRLARKFGQFEVEGALSGLSGEVDYRGFAENTQTGALTPDRKTSDAQIFEASIRIARWFLATGDRVALYAGAGYRRWDRDVADTAASVGSSLDYTWPFAMLGAKFSLHRTERASLMVDVRITKPIDPQVELRFTNLTKPVTLEMSSKIGYRVEVPFSYKLTQTGGIEIAPFYERIKLKESDPERLTALDPSDPEDLNGRAVTEPDSETEVFGLNIHWLQEF